MPTAVSLRFHADGAALDVGDRRVRIAPGLADFARAHFRRWPPTPLELENAIAAVEDSLAAARSFVPTPMELSSGEPLLRQLAAGAARLERERIEDHFAWLAMTSAGSPGPLPPGQPIEWAAAVTILRELMHHWGIEAIEVGRWVD